MFVVASAAAMYSASQVLFAATDCCRASHRNGALLTSVSIPAIDFRVVISVICVGVFLDMHVLAFVELHENTFGARRVQILGEPLCKVPMSLRWFLAGSSEGSGGECYIW